MTLDKRNTFRYIMSEVSFTLGDGEMALNKKEQICNAAIKIIAQEGFHSTTTDKIAAQAGVAVGTIYNYFQNKEDILRYIFKVEHEKRASFFHRLQKRDLHPVEKIRAILEMHFSEVRNNPNIIKIILGERKFSCQEHYAESRNKGLPLFLEQIIQDGLAEGRVKKCDPRIVALVLVGAIEAVMASYLQEKHAGKEGDILTSAVDEITSLISCGLNIE
jgi:TetR/AcrR family fatty acid metabolism transcriptional regulator